MYEYADWHYKNERILAAEPIYKEYVNLNPKNPEGYKTIADQYLKAAQLIEDPEILKIIQEMTVGIREPLEKKGFDFRFYVVEEKSFNAMAFPDGTIVIHSGLFEKTNSDRQVIGVLAHELAHVSEKHQLRGLAEKAGVLVIASAIMGDIGGLFDVIVGGGAKLYLLKNSRDFEREADETGVELMEHAHLDPKGLVETFEIMGKEMEDMSIPQEQIDWLSTHPSSPERVRYLKEMAESAEGPFLETKDKHLKLIKERLEKNK